MKDDKVKGVVFEDIGYYEFSGDIYELFYTFWIEPNYETMVRVQPSPASFPRFYDVNEDIESVEIFLNSERNELDSYYKLRTIEIMFY